MIEIGYFFLGRPLSFFLTKGILIAFVSVFDTVKVKSGSLYAFINSCISSLILFFVIFHFLFLKFLNLI